MLINASYDYGDANFSFLFLLPCFKRRIINILNLKSFFKKEELLML